MNILLTLSAVMLLLSGSYFTLRFRAFYLVHPVKTVKAVPKDGVKQMLLSLGGTVGVGNIAGVAVALSIGGSGAVFWMWIGAAVAMALKYAEITLGMLHGNTLYYIRKTLGGLAAALFAGLLIADALIMGGIIQAGAVSEILYSSYGVSRVVCGIFLSLLAAAVFFFKLDLFRLSSFVVPIMSIGYVVCAVAVILFHSGEIPQVLQDIFDNAFCTKSAVGGALGFLFTPAMRQGIVKGLFSNEAGCGTAPMAHSASEEKVPARQGLFGIFEVFVDTLLMCTLTAFAILLTGNGNTGGVSACVNAFSSVFGAFSPMILSVSVFLFAFSAIISFGYYGTQCIGYFVPTAKGSNAFLLTHCISVFVGATIAPAIAWKSADFIVSVMLIINTTAVLMRRKEILTAHNSFYSQIGNLSHKASKTRAFSDGSTKNEIPISETEIKRGSIS